MNLKMLDTLKAKLVEATDFSTVLTYFFDHFGEDVEFVKASERVNNKFLEGVLAGIAAEALGEKKARPVMVMMMGVKKYRFIHGGIQMRGALGTFIYFEDLDKGLLGICKDPRSGEMKYARFSLSLLKKPEDPSRN
jgi:hypothetical protein